jgi:hypothetical protein
MSGWDAAYRIAQSNPDVTVNDGNVTDVTPGALIAPKGAKRHTPSEHEEQAALFEWAALAQGQHPELAMLFAVPNGGQRHPAVAAQLKAEGVRAGVPDVFLAVARGRFHGLAIEMKVKPNRTTEAQDEWIARLRYAGYMAVTCWSANEAIGVIMAYLEQEW